MLAELSFPACSDARFAASNPEPAVSSQHAPDQNRLLASLPSEDYEHLLPDLQPVALPIGWTVDDVGHRDKYLYFVTEGIVGKFYMMQNGMSAGFAIAGNEGVIGIASILGGETMPSQAVVLSAGYAYRLSADLLKSEFAHGGLLLPTLLRYTQVLITQTGQIVVCNRHHSVEQQLCRLILSCLDRLSSNELMMTQELIAALLGVRRESVTEAAGKLQQAGLILYRRGHIAVLDRRQLEAHACECYRAVRDKLDRLPFPKDTLGHTAQHHPATRYRPMLAKAFRARGQRRSTCSTALASAQRNDGR